MDMEKVEKLIEIVRGHIFLYDLGHKQYKNASLKSEIWESIGRDLNESGETVKNKWKTVRDGYTKYKKQLKTSTGSSKKNISYTWASQLSFLDNFNMPRATYSNELLDTTQPSPCAQALALESDNSQDMTSPLPSSSQDPPTSQVLPPDSARASYRNNKRSSEKKRDDDDVGRVLQFLNAKKRKQCDVIDNLFLSYADTFKKFPPREQAIVKLELAKLFSNTELQLLNDNSNESHFQYTSIVSPAYSTTSSVENHTFYTPKPQSINLFVDNYNNVAQDNSAQLVEEKPHLARR